MRIYTRGENQSLVINHNVTVTVLRVFSDHVRIAISVTHDSTFDGLELDDSSLDNSLLDDSTPLDAIGSDDSNDRRRGGRSKVNTEYWETDLYLPENVNLEDVELELSQR